jgi:hypothetical protein
MDQATTRTATDTSAALNFIHQWFGATEQPVYICSLANDRDDSKEPTERHVATREGKEVDAFIAKWDRTGRGLFFCVSTIKPGAIRNKDNVVEIPGLWADVDFKDVIDDEATILRRVKALPKPPSIIVRSGNGLHLYWRFKESLTVNIVDGAETIERVEAALKQLADLCGGDMKLTQVAALICTGSPDRIVLTMSEKCQTPLLNASCSTHGALRRNSISPCVPSSAPIGVAMGFDVSKPEIVLIRSVLPVLLMP